VQEKESSLRWSLGAAWHEHGVSVVTNGRHPVASGSRGAGLGLGHWVMAIRLVSRSGSGKAVVNWVRHLGGIARPCKRKSLLEEWAAVCPIGLKKWNGGVGWRKGKEEKSWARVGCVGGKRKEERAAVRGRKQVSAQGQFHL
jgi:hypothetical protein